MSTLPADIYITRDAFDQGEHHGRLVCAIFVHDPNFVEITVHPEDGGRFSQAPETRPATAPMPSDPSDVPASPELGVEYPLRVYVHCGLEGVPLPNGWWLFENRGGVNPPPGFGNPWDDGTITFLDEETAIFRSSGGVEERLVRVEGEPAGPACF